MKAVPYAMMAAIVLGGCVEASKEESGSTAPTFLTAEQIRVELVDQPLQTNTPSRWVFRGDGVEYSYGTDWVAKGRWTLQGDFLCWEGTYNGPDEIDTYARCSRVAETGDGFAFTQDRDSNALNDWGVRRAESIGPEPQIRQP